MQSNTFTLHLIGPAFTCLEALCDFGLIPLKYRTQEVRRNMDETRGLSKVLMNGDQAPVKATETFEWDKLVDTLKSQVVLTDGVELIDTTTQRDILPSCIVERILGRKSI